MSMKYAHQLKVMRFYGNIDYAMDTLSNQQAIFIHNSILNDPFDPFFSFETDFNEEYGRLIEHVKRKHPNELSWFLGFVSESDWVNSVSNIHSAMDKNRNSSFVFSCCEVSSVDHPKDNLYMWSHYGNGHRGVAIEFDADKLVALFDIAENDLDNSLNQDQIWGKVKYVKDHRPVSAEMIFDFYRKMRIGRQLKSSVSDYFGAQLLVKSRVWEMEKEWRLILKDESTRSKIKRVPIPEEAVIGVYVGLASGEVGANDIIFETKRKYKNAKVFRMRRTNGFLRLGFDEI